MISISIDNIESLKEDLEQFLDKYIFDRLSPEHNRNHHKIISTHPAYTWWNSFCDDAKKSLENNHFQLSEGSIFLLELFNNYKTLKDVDNKERIFDKLIHINDFHSTLYEAYVAAQYIEFGYDVIIQDEGSVEGKKMCDFIVAKDANKIAIEAKNLDDLFSEESIHWQEIISKVINTLLLRKQSYFVTISLNKRIDGKDVDLILREVRTQSKSEFPNEELVFENISIKFEQIGDWSQEYRLPVEIPTKGINKAHSSIITNDDNTSDIINVIVVDIIPFFDKDISRRVIRQIGKAAKQLPKDIPSLIQICIPFKYGSDFLSVIDESYNNIFRYLNTNYTSINAVIITAFTISDNLQNDSNLLNYNNYIIPCANSKHELPLQILGANVFIDPPEEILAASQDNCIVEPFEAFEQQPMYPSSFSEITDFLKDIPEGTIAIETRDNISLLDKVGYPLLWLSSHDGKGQLRLWVDYNRKFRIEIINQYFGRAFFTSKKFVETSNYRVNKFAFTWSADGIIVALNGDILEFE